MAIGIHISDEYMEDDRDLGSGFWERRAQDIEGRKAVSRARHAILRKATARAHAQLEEFLGEDYNSHS